MAPAEDPAGHVTVTFFSGGACKSHSAGGGGSTGQTTVEPFPSQAAATLASITSYVNSLQENLEANGFMDPEVSHSVHVTEGVRVHVRMSEKRRRKRFDQIVKVSSERAARQVNLAAGVPLNWEEILKRGPRRGKWPRTDWDWVACMEWDVWKQVFSHDRDYEKEVAKSHLSWREKAIVRVAKVLTWMEKFSDH